MSLKGFNQTDFAALAPLAQYCTQKSLSGTFAGIGSLVPQINAFLQITILPTELIFNVQIDVWVNGGISNFFATATLIPVEYMRIQTGASDSVRIPYSQTDFLNATPQGGKMTFTGNIFNFTNDAATDIQMNNLFLAFPAEDAAFNTVVQRFNTGGSEVLIGVFYFTPSDLLT